MLDWTLYTAHALNNKIMYFSDAPGNGCSLLAVGLHLFSVVLVSVCVCVCDK